MFQNPEKEEDELPIAKDCEVEVCSEEEGFIGAWYRAILEETPTKSGRKKLRVRYMTLVQEDGSTLLTETVEQRFIRPHPPEDLYDDVVFVEGSVVDADLKDGWWNGVVLKILEDDKFLVYFDTPPDVIQFDRKQLRPHLDWTDSEWVRPENKELSTSLFSSGTMVEVSRKIDKMESVWVPAIVIKEVGDKKELVVKSCNKSLTFNADEVNPSFTVDLCNVRPIPPPSLVEEYNLLDRVDAFDGFAWRQCVVRGVLSEEHYKVSFVATKEETEFKHSDLRPTKEWEDGVWHQRPKRHTEKETPSDSKRKKSITSETTLSEINMNRPKKLKLVSSCVATKPITPTGGNAAVTSKCSRKRTRKSRTQAIEDETELSETVDEMESYLAQYFGNHAADDLMNATPVITPEMITQVIEKESTPVESEAETQGMTTPKKTLQPTQGIDSTGEKIKRPIRISLKGKNYKRKREQKQDSNVKETEALIANTSDNVLNDDDDQPLSAWILGQKSCHGSDKSMLGTPNAVKNSAADETRASEDTTMVLPFVKQSPVWKVLESMEVFKTAKQSPHFIPLLDIREEFREGSAVGEMVKFSNLLERVKSLQLHTPISTLEGLKECFFELQKYGFDVTAPISRIDMLLSLIDENVSIEDKLKDNEKEKTEEVSNVQKVEEDLKDVEGKILELILELQSQKADLNLKKDASEQKISRMDMCAENLNKRSQEVELEFQKIASASW